ncbi:hypothetical protein V6N11_084368 [Hibiscus sabdariffa]|uniref:Uncharacterized protein n=1 Tax=Hibiscus sabdariffa TaxID=183260 RepID=A0ABR2QSP1_9ROSI
MLNITGLSSKCSASNSGIVVELLHLLEQDRGQILVHADLLWSYTKQKSRGFDILLRLDDKGDVSARDNGSGLGRLSRLVQISAERLAELLACV